MTVQAGESTAGELRAGSRIEDVVWAIKLAVDGGNELTVAPRTVAIVKWLLEDEFLANLEPGATHPTRLFLAAIQANKGVLMAQADESTVLVKEATIRGLLSMLDDAQAALLRIAREGLSRDEMAQAAEEALRELGVESGE